MSDLTPFWNLPAKVFPFTIRIVRCRDGVELWSYTCERPDRYELSAVRIPGYGGTPDAPVRVRIEFADGTIEEHGPPEVKP